MCIPVKDGALTREKHIKAQALPMTLAMAWTEEADKLSAALLSASGPGERVKAMEAMLDAVCDYDKAFPAQDIRDNASAVQVATAFEVLRELNDPLAVAREKQQAEQNRNMELLAKLPQSVVADLMQKSTQETPSQ